MGDPLSTVGSDNESCNTQCNGRDGPHFKASCGMLAAAVPAFPFSASSDITQSMWRRKPFHIPLEVKCWKAQARVGEDVGLGSGSGRWTLGEGQAGYGGDGVDYKGEWKAMSMVCGSRPVWVYWATSGLWL